MHLSLSFDTRNKSFTIANVSFGITKISSTDDKLILVSPLYHSNAALMVLCLLGITMILILVIFENYDVFMPDREG
jgi:hypothetical protein